MSIYKDKFTPEYQDSVGFYANRGGRKIRFLHKNSKELMLIMKENNLIQDGWKYFEIGAGGCRNQDGDRRNQ